jgi:hypothetical protein
MGVVTSQVGDGTNLSGISSGWSGDGGSPSGMGLASDTHHSVRGVEWRRWVAIGDGA